MAQCKQQQKCVFNNMVIRMLAGHAAGDFSLHLIVLYRLQYDKKSNLQMVGKVRSGRLQD